MSKIDRTVLRETKYITFIVIILSVLMNSLFLVFRRWDYTVILGNLLSASVAIMNFLLMGITVQKAMPKEPSDARKFISASQKLRSFGIFVIIGVGALTPCFNIISLTVPIFFPRVAVSLRPLIKQNADKDVVEE